MNKRSSRRRFLKSTATAIAMTSAPSFIPQHIFSQTAPSDKVTVGHIGIGWRGMELLRQTYRNENINVAALCDCDMNFLVKRMGFLDDQNAVDRKWILGEGWDAKPAPSPKGSVDGYLDYRKLLERKDIDAAVIAVPDHWHAKLYMDAMNAGKDVYGEKPLTLSIEQGRRVVRKADETGQVFQTGMQQRSDPLFRKACEYVRNGRLGKLEYAKIAIHGGSQIKAVPDEPAPPGLNWDMWLGPAPKVPYNPSRCHVSFRWFFEYSGGQVSDLGVHHADIAQWGLGTDGTGPRYIEGFGKTHEGYYNTFNEYKFTMTYDDGRKIIIESMPGFDLYFKGEKGEIFVNRSKIESTPSSILEEPLTDNDIRLQKSDDHMQHFVECIRTRKRPITDAETGHYSATVCHLANICGVVGRKLEWDPQKEIFVNDPEANSYLDRFERAGYET